jgi:hypothetical protein
MPADFKRDEYNDHIDDWKMADAAVSGRGVEEYLPWLNPNDKNSDENQKRNKEYRDGAVFYPISGQTLQGMIGMAFREDPEISMPQGLEYLERDADGAEVTIIQQAQDIMAEVLKKGRCGLYVTFPKVEGDLSRADMETGGYQATIHVIDARQIINWRYESVGGRRKLALVVISETAEIVEDDGFSLKKIDQIRVLQLAEGIFSVTTWQKPDKEWIVIDEAFPTDSAGTSWTEIPFVFIGSQANTAAIDTAPLMPLIDMNMAHYRNSADVEDSAAYSGQAQPWASGITLAALDLMKKHTRFIGSRHLLSVPHGETFGFAAAPANTISRELMRDKLDVMIGLGAQIISDNGTAKTATEAKSDEAARTSALSMVANNVSDAYQRAITWAGRFMGDAGDIVFEISQDFIPVSATAQELQAMVAGFVQGVIPASVYFDWFKARNLVPGDMALEDFQGEINQSSLSLVE